MTRIALDAMGGDDAPAATVAGAMRAHRRHGTDIVLVGDPGVLAPALAREDAERELVVVPAAQLVGMDEDPALAVRAKPDASIRVAAQLVADGRADALVSAGSTGATLASALLALGRTPGVRRPVIAAVVPLGGSSVVLVDAGGSADAQAEALVEYARMGMAYAQVRGIDTPRVALLNVGAEPRKGNALARSAFELLATVPGFVGNLEPEAALSGSAEVLVTDGFTGNIFLKTIEAVHPDGRVRGALHAVAVLLGVRGEVLVTHGAAGAEDIAAALDVAARVADAGLSTRVAAQLAPRQPPF